MRMRSMLIAAWREQKKKMGWLGMDDFDKYVTLFRDTFKPGL